MAPSLALGQAACLPVAAAAASVFEQQADLLGRSTLMAGAATVVLAGRHYAFAGRLGRRETKGAKILTASLGSSFRPLRTG
jgi:hypothetical protein